MTYSRQLVKVSETVSYLNFKYEPFKLLNVSLGFTLTNIFCVYALGLQSCMTSKSSLFYMHKTCIAPQCFADI